MRKVEIPKVSEVDDLNREPGDRVRSEVKRSEIYKEAERGRDRSE